MTDERMRNILAIASVYLFANLDDAIEAFLTCDDENPESVRLVRVNGEDIEPPTEEEVQESFRVMFARMGLHDRMVERWKKVRAFSESTGEGMTGAMVDKGLVDWLDDQLHEMYGGSSGETADPLRPDC